MRSEFRYMLAFALVVAALFLWCGQTLAADPVYIPAPVFVQPPKSAPLKFAAPAFDCPNCTQCANGCDCFGGGYYCADGKCPVGFNAPAGYTTVCENGVCRLVPISGPATGQPFFMSSGSCASGSCGTAPSYSGGAFMSSGGACQSAGPSGWWLGKKLGKQPPPWKR